MNQHSCDILQVRRPRSMFRVQLNPQNPLFKSSNFARESFYVRKVMLMDPKAISLECRQIKFSVLEHVDSVTLVPIFRFFCPSFF